MQWIPLTAPDQLVEVDEVSQQGPVLLFKHSTSCSISRMALDRLERAWRSPNDAPMPIYFIDLWQHREVSNAVERHYGIRHESPQVLVIHQGRCVYDASHSAIRAEELQRLSPSN